MPNEPFDKKGTLIANGNKVAPETWASCVLYDPDPTKTLLQILGQAFKNVSVAAQSGGIVLTFGNIGGTSITATIRDADASHKGVISAPMFRKIDALPDADTIPDKTEDLVDYVDDSALADKIILNFQNGDDSTLFAVNLLPASLARAGLVTATEKASLMAVARLADLLKSSVSVSIENTQEMAAYLQPRIFGVTKTVTPAGESFTNISPMYRGERLALIADEACTLTAGSSAVPYVSCTFNSPGEQKVIYTAASDVTINGVTISNLAGHSSVNLTLVILPPLTT